MRQILTNRIAVSTVLLPVAIVCAVVLWFCLLPLPLVLRTIPLTALTAYVLMEMNSRYTLLRVRSRVISSFYTLTAPILVASLVAVDPLFADNCVRTFTTVFIVMVSMAIMMRVYERDNAPVTMFHGFALLSVVAFLCPPLVFCLPLMWVQLFVHMHALSLRNLVASLFGVVLVAMGVFIFCFVRYLMTGALPDNMSMFQLSIETEWPSLWHILCSSSYIFTLLIGAVALIYYIYNALDDKLQVRMSLYLFVVQWTATQLLLLCFPSYSSLFIILAWTLSCPLVGHQLALSHSRWTTVWAMLMVVSVVSRYTYYILT